MSQESESHESEDSLIEGTTKAVVSSGASSSVSQGNLPASRHAIDVSVLFDASPLPIWILDSQSFAFLAVNKAAITRYGYTEEEFLGMTLQEVCVPEDMPKFAEQLSHLPFDFKRTAVLRHRARDGTLLFVEPARQETEYNGRSAVFSILNDVTERTHTEEALRASEASLKASRELLETTLRSIGDAVITTDPQGHVTLMNAVAQRLTGWSEARARGRDVQEVFRIVNETTRAPVENPIRRVLEEKATVGLANHTMLLSKDGREYAIDDSGAPIQDASGTLYGAVLVFHDISARRRQEQALQESEERTRLILQTSLDAVVEIDSANRISGWNRQAEQIFGWSQEEAVGQLLTDTIIPVQHRAAHLKGLEHFARTGQGSVLNRRIEITACRRNGEEFPVELAITPIKTARGMTFSAFVRDISQRSQDELARQFLTKATEVLASSLDYAQTLQKVADLAVPHIADWCGVDMLEEDGSIRLLAVAHVDPEKVRWGHELRRLYPPDPDEPGGLPNVLRTGQSEIYPDIPDELLVATARDARHLEMARYMGLRSVMIVPILAHARVLGAITFVTTNESGQNYTEEDLVLAEGLAARAALAVENARLYRAAQEELKERRRMQEALRKSEERFRFALANSNIIVYTQDHDLRYTWIYNGAVNDEEPQIYGKTDAEIVIPEDAAHLIAIKRRVLQTGIEERHVLRATPPGREARYFDISIAPVHDTKNNVIGITGTANDITERKRAQDALIEHHTEIEALNVRLQRSMSETHHRVKNNLQIIAALLDMQEMQHEEVVPLSEIVRLRQHVTSLSTIHDLLTYQAKKDAEVYDLSVKEMIEKLVPILQGMTAGRTIEAVVEDLRMPVRQSTTLTVLVNELVSNAVKHGRGEIHLAFFTREGKALLEVSDEGPGFPEAFDPAAWANTGLELVQTLARLDLQGETLFDNRATGGAWVGVEFPIPGTIRTPGEQ